MESCRDLEESNLVHLHRNHWASSFSLEVKLDP